ncbi:MAG: helix-turn-helix domain-containing protein [Ruminococcaceae bacterium]|nr:helix-turn-helix domain-containing protein [Oscillospiraceae bacterium]
MNESLLALNFSVGDLPCRLFRVTPEIHSATANNYYQHRHPSMELHYVTAGRCSIATDNTICHVSENQLLLIPPAIYHYTCDATPDSSRMTISIQLDPPVSRKQENLAHRIFAAFSLSSPLLLEVPPSSTLADVLRQVRTLSPTSGAVTQEKLRALSQFLILELFDMLTCAEPASLPPSIAPPTPQDFVIDEFFGRSFHLNNGAPLLAQQLNVSTRQLSRIIKQAYGINYRDKLKEIRLEIALELLTHSDKSIAQIAQLQGYSSPANFSAFIKNATGKTPSQLRKEARTFL